MKTSLKENPIKIDILHDIMKDPNVKLLKWWLEHFGVDESLMN